MIVVIIVSSILRLAFVGLGLPRKFPVPGGGTCLALLQLPDKGKFINFVDPDLRLFGFTLAGNGKNLYMSVLRGH